MALIHIAGNTYELIIENRNGWNVEAFRNRYSEVLERYDYIVGDWGYNQLRLKGFFKDGHQKATKDSTFSYITDYINEYCNFGCAYFLLEKKQGNESVEISDDDIYIEEVEYTRTIPVPAVKEAKTKSAASASAVAEEAPASNQKDSSSRGKRSGQRDKQNDQAQDAGNEKQRQRNGQKQNAAKQQTSQLDNAAAEGKQDNKKEGKSKRKDHFYRKGNRYQDKKAKANKNQSEQMSSGSKS